MKFKKLLCVIMSLLLAFQTLTPALADDSRVYYCNQEEHTHTDECYTIYKVLSCEEEHTHTDECFQVYKFLDCELSEHIHNNKCEEEDYKEEQLEEKQEDIEIIEKAIKGEEYFSIICEKEEHTHEKSCFDTVLNCTEEHEHEKSCYIDKIICKKEEHTHIIDCVLDETPITNYDIEELKEDFESEGFVTLQECDDKLLTGKELEKTTIENIDAMLKSAIPQEGIEPTVLPVTVDGISIEKATIRWLSKSTGSNTPAKFDDLVLVPPDNTMPNQQWQLDFALSGKGFIEPGDLEIVIPAYIYGKIEMVINLED